MNLIAVIFANNLNFNKLNEQMKTNSFGSSRMALKEIVQNSSGANKNIKMRNAETKVAVKSKTVSGPVLKPTKKHLINAQRAKIILAAKNFASILEEKSVD